MQTSAEDMVLLLWYSVVQNICNPDAEICNENTSLQIIITSVQEAGPGGGLKIAEKFLLNLLTWEMETIGLV